MSKFRTSLIAILVGLGANALVACPSRAADPSDPAGADASPSRSGLKAGDWLVHGRVIGLIPTERRSHIDPIGGRIDTPNAFLPDLDVTYFLTDHFAIEGQAGAVRSRPVIRDSLVGDINIGSIWNAAASGAVRYHVLPTARFNPYVGVGVSATTPLAVHPAKGIPTFPVKSEISPLLQAGFEYHLSGNWFANAMVKYVFVSPQSYNIAGVKVEADLNMLVIGAGLGYRF